jgi:hypothetical protein
MLFFIKGTNKETRKHLRVDAVSFCQKRTGKALGRSDTFMNCKLSYALNKAKMSQEEMIKITQRYII